MKTADPIDRTAGFAPAPRLVIGITCAQTCLVLKGRLRTLREAGFHVTLVSSPGPLLDSIAQCEGVEPRALLIERQIAPFRDLVSLIRMWGLLRQLKPDIVEFSTPKAGLLGMLASLLARVPRRVYLLRGLKLETTRGFKRAILLLAERVAAKCANVVLCNSASLWNGAIFFGIGSRQKLEMIGNGSSMGVDVQRFTPGASAVRSGLGIPEHADVIGFVGRLTRDKGLPELLDAFDALLSAKPDVWLLLVGWFDAAEDAIDSGLRQRILRNPQVVCTGFVKDPADYYRAMDMMILPSRREGLPNVVLEASASGIPVITTLSTGARDAVFHEITGLLVPPGDPEALCKAALRLLHDPGLRYRMGAAGRAWVTRMFSREEALATNAEFYKRQLRTISRERLSPMQAMDLAAPLR